MPSFHTISGAPLSSVVSPSSPISNNVFNTTIIGGEADSKISGKSGNLWEYLSATFNVEKGYEEWLSSENITGGDRLPGEFYANFAVINKIFSDSFSRLQVLFDFIQLESQQGIPASRMRLPAESLFSAGLKDSILGEFSGSNNLVSTKSAVETEWLGAPKSSEKASEDSFSPLLGTKQTSGGENLISNVRHDSIDGEYLGKVNANQRGASTSLGSPSSTWRIEAENLGTIQAKAAANLAESMIKVLMAGKDWVESIATSNQIQATSLMESLGESKKSIKEFGETIVGFSSTDNVETEFLGGARDMIFTGTALAIEILTDIAIKVNPSADFIGTSNIVSTQSMLFADTLQNLATSANILADLLEGPSAVDNTRRLIISRSQRLAEISQTVRNLVISGKK